jgi:cell division septal protein FtsQ
MKSVKEVLQKHINENGDNFGIKITIDKINKKQVELKEFWGNLSIYENLSKDLRKEGYTVFD